MYRFEPARTLSVKSGPGLPVGMYEEPALGVERVGGPGAAAGDRDAVRISPGRPGLRLHLLVSGLRCVGRHRVGFPHDLAGSGVERVDASLHAVDVASRRADEHEPVPRNRRRRDTLALVPARQPRRPQLLSGCRVVRQHVALARASEEAPVEIGRAAVDGQSDRWTLFAHPPFLSAGLGIHRQDLFVGRRIQHAADDDRAGLEARVDVEVVDAQLLQLRDVGSIDLIERREPVGRERAVIARPVGSGVLGCRLGAEARCGERQRDGRRDRVGPIGNGRLHGPSLLQALSRVVRSIELMDVGRLFGRARAVGED